MLKKIFEFVYDAEKHSKYDKNLEKKWYKEYLDSLRLEWFTRLLDIRLQLQIQKQIDKLTPEPTYKIHYPD